MSLLIILVHCYFNARRAQALPIPTIERPPSCDDLHNCRTIWSLIWSCMATILLCIWVAVHPNIPGPDERWTKVTLQRVGIALIALVAPELIILWAIRQWLNAHEIGRKYQKYGWTRTHGFFAVMGGFMLYEDDKPPSIIDPSDLGPYLRRGEIDITQKEIQDRSRGDVLSKGLVVVQTGWFILQCIARSSKHLPITEIELVTLAFATLNFVTYGLWWDKPLGAQCPYRIVRKRKPMLQNEAEREGPAECECEEGRQSGYKGTVLCRSKNNILDIGKTTGTIARTVPIILTRKTMATFHNIAACVHEKGTWRTVVHVAWVTYANSLGKIGYMGLKGSDDIAPGAESVRMFYAGKLICDNMERRATLAASAIATLFGAIHCIAWSFEFESHTEKWLWRISSLTITCIPPVLFVGFRFDTRIQPEAQILGFPFALLAGILYVLARILLLVLPFVSLRSLPPGAYQTVHWTTFIPHI
ncbi:hypothetical protein PILCRDRAFT_11937 [Piloderma croceum F 1598]|uniref:Uncharacterized protein n=1 Tax=Piloderma croceum (strain F 1598) TaxID=765440 RepID=A0A0C3FCH6_PILCF|nr:hypothetical protein PILCRDRAFT_11937 [Piloderma croceum F 1598]